MRFVLQCGAVCCSVVQCVAGHCSVLQGVSSAFCVAVQCVAGHCSVLQGVSSAFSPSSAQGWSNRAKNATNSSFAGFLVV